MNSPAEGAASGSSAGSADAATGPGGWKSRLPLRFLSGLFLWFFLTVSGRVGFLDAGIMLDFSRTLSRGSVTLAPDCRQCVEGVDGTRTSPYGPATSVWWIPWLLAGKAAAALAPSIPAPMWEEFFVSFANVPVIGLLLVYLALAWRRAGASESRIRWGLLLLALATPLGPYAKHMGSDSLMALALFAAWFHWTASGSRHAAMAGVWLGVAMLSRRQADAIIPVLLAFAGLDSLRRGGLNRLGVVVLAMLPLVFVRLAYNAVRFGSPWIERQPGISGAEVLTATGWMGRLRDVLFSELSGIIPYCAVPVLIAALALPRFWRVNRSDALVMLSLVVSGVILLTSLPFGPGVCFGPRYAVYLIPFLALAWPCFEFPKRWAARAGLGGVLVFSVWLTMSGMALDSVPVVLRANLLSPPGVVFKAMAGEWRRVLSLNAVPDLPELTARADWQHDAFRRPDFWWCHLWARWRGGLAHADSREAKPGTGAPDSRAR